MARRRKTRTHKQAQRPADAPSSFVVRHGRVGPSISQLVRDMRKVMEPHTASRLKERARNKLKDFIVIGPSLHVSHLLAFTLADLAPTFRIIRLPSGPTLTFRVQRYSLSKDILHISNHARSMGLEYLTPPLLVCASFPSPAPPHLSLLIKSFQSLFPPLSPGTLNLSAARRVVLLAYSTESDTVQFRHYLVSVRPFGVSSRIQKVTNAPSANVLDLGKEKDIADFFLRRSRSTPGPGEDDEGYESAVSSNYGDDPDATLDLPSDYLGRNNRKGERRAVKLDEIGPRMELALLKISEGLPGKEGGVIYHRFVKKSKAEAARQKVEHATKAKLKQQRKEEQERNVAAKEAKSARREVESESYDDPDDEWDDSDRAEDSDFSEAESQLARSKKRKLQND